jgi:hypothetical protein
MKKAEYFVLIYTLAIKYCIADGTCNIFCNVRLPLSGTLAF